MDEHSRVGPFFLLSVILVVLPLFANGVTNETSHVEEINPTCDCGKYGVNCAYINGAKICDCLQGFKQNGDLCERCDCRRHTIDCNFVDGKMNCTCDEGYIQKDDICVHACSEDKPCLNGGTCSNGVCSCRNGISGNLCQIVVLCEYDQLCGADQDTTCVYDVQEEKAVCGCRKENQVFVSDEKKCRIQCNGTSDCQYGGQCIKKEEGQFCQCKKDTTGDFCASVVCKEECYVGADCKYDLKLEKSYCECKNKDERPDQKQKTCRKPCKLDKECKFGAKCTVSNNEKFCDCKNGTAGNFCERCEKCGDGNDVECVPSVDGAIKCVCRKGKEFDRVTKTCRVPCESNDECHHDAYCTEKEKWYDDTPVEPGDRKYCRCPRGTSGDFCQIVDDCLPEKKFCGEGDDVECLYSTAHDWAFCHCIEGDKAFHQEEKVCKECNCGAYANSCTYVEGVKICTCDRGYHQVNDTCEECRCGPYSRGCLYLESLSRKMCLCERGFAENGPECEECDCGANSDSCSFVDGQKTCKCSLPTYVQNEGLCVRKCDDTLSRCRNGGVCNQETRFCDCKEGTKGIRCEEIIDCEQFNICGGSTDATCTYNEKLEEAYCKCPNDLHQFDEQDMKCKECYCGKKGTCSFVNNEKTCECAKNYVMRNGICTECNCGKFGSCYFDGNDKKCNCSYGYSAKDGICAECYCGGSGTCSFDGSGKKVCRCDDGAVLNNGRCQRPCSKDSQCFNGGICRNTACQCPEGTSGDDCRLVDGCKALEETCRNGGATCKFDSEKDQKAACICENEDFIFDEDKKSCVAKWCQENSCDDRSTCEFDAGSRTGYCKCKTPSRYYDYIERKCKPIDPCQLKICGEHEVCIEGECRCSDGYDGFTSHDCEPKFCKRGTCFDGGSCEETDIPGVVSCVCDGSLFFDGSECDYGICSIPKYNHLCYERCPPDMVRNNDGDCEPKDENRKCEKDCKRGWCIKEGDKEVCKCFSRHTVFKNGTCMLNANMCASKKLTPDSSKCDCSGMFKYAEDGFTCERRSCKDEDVQEECRKVRATSCRDRWRIIGANVGFECVCAPGFGKDSSGICRKTCELENQVAECSKTHSICYLDENYEPHCRCPPTFSLNEEEQECEYHGENAFLLRNIPVMKQKYVNKDGSIDRMLLHADVIQSINAMYAKEVLDSAYLSIVKEIGEVLFCDVVLQFRRTTKSTAGRFGLQVIKNILRADYEDRVAMLPPSLVLQNNITVVSIEEVDFCSESVKNLLCGVETKCKDRKCSCLPGYRLKEGSLKETDNYTILKCEDIDECKEGFDTCTENTTCINTPGDYYCRCNPGFKKIGELLPFQNEINKHSCVDLCASNPCNRGQCNVKDKMIDCKCDVGFVGSLCDVEDVHLKKAKNVTKIVSGVLGALLLVTIALFIVYVVSKQRMKKNDSEDVFVSQVSRQTTENNGNRK